MQACIPTLHNSTLDTTADSQLEGVSRQACRGGYVITAQPLPPLSRLQRLASWLKILVCACPACRIPPEKQSNTEWRRYYFRLE
jgi:hypothetical protein